MPAPNAPKIETRNVHQPVELRAADDGDENRLVGYAAKFGVESEVLTDPWDRSEFVEIIAPTAFDRTLREQPDVRALAQHDSSKVLGRVKSGTLRLWVDSVGLRFEVDLPDAQYARDLKASVKRGDIDGCSFGFVCRADSVALVGGRLVRTLDDIELIEVSTGVTWPAYLDSQVSLRSRVPAARPPVGTPLRDAARRRLALIDLG